jgi:hypothetical protein
MKQDGSQLRIARGARSTDWYKSSFSSDVSGNCVEVAWRPRAVLVRDSQDPLGGQLAVPVDRWAMFTEVARKF